MFNAQKFLNDWPGARMRAIIAFCLNKHDWFPYQKLFDFSIKESLNIAKHTGKFKTRHCIMTLIKIGFLLADPEKGLKFNPDFTPKNQTKIIK